MRRVVQFRRLRMSRRTRQGIVCDLRETGTARLIFDENRTKFQGALETANGETIFVRGKKMIPTTADPSTSDNSSLTTMTVDIVDGEEGSLFRVLGVQVEVQGCHVAIDSSAIKFLAEERIIGMKAAVEIRQHMKPSLAENNNELFVGPMKIEVLTSHRPPPSRRRESICSDNHVILEVSDDFLA